MGPEGCGRIKEFGGITFAQDERSAKYPDMPLNALRSGVVDTVLPPDAIGVELGDIARHIHLRQSNGRRIRRR